MPPTVLCLRPKDDFLRVGVTPPETLSIGYDRPDNPDLAALIKAAEALVIPAVGPALPADLFKDSKVRMVQVTGAGVDRLNEAGMKDLKIPVANVPGGSNTALAEYAVATSLLLLRRFAWADAEIRKGNYAGFRARMVSDNLSGLEDLTVGIVGLGTIGLAVAQAFHRMGSRIVYHDPTPRDPAAIAAIDAKPVTLTALFKSADVVSLHVPLLAATKGMIGANELAAMKPGAVLINAARGGIVDEAALAGALMEGKLGGAAIDVYATEPPSPDNPLFALTGEAALRVLFTPHIAGITRQSWQSLFRTAWQNVEDVLIRNAPVRHRVY